MKSFTKILILATGLTVLNGMEKESERESKRNIPLNSNASSSQSQPYIDESEEFKTSYRQLVRRNNYLTEEYNKIFEKHNDLVKRYNALLRETGDVEVRNQRLEILINGNHIDLEKKVREMHEEIQEIHNSIDTIKRSLGIFY